MNLFKEILISVFIINPFGRSKIITACMDAVIPEVI